MPLILKTVTKHIPVSKQTGHSTLAHNFAKCWPIFKILHQPTQKQTCNEMITKDPTVLKYIATTPCKTYLVNVRKLATALCQSSPHINQTLPQITHILHFCLVNSLLNYAANFCQDGFPWKKRFSPVSKNLQVQWNSAFFTHYEIKRQCFHLQYNVIKCVEMLARKWLAALFKSSNLLK